MEYNLWQCTSTHQVQVVKTALKHRSTSQGTLAGVSVLDVSSFSFDSNGEADFNLGSVQLFAARSQELGVRTGGKLWSCTRLPGRVPRDAIVGF